MFQYDVYICTTVLMKRNQIQVSLFLTCSNSLLDLLSTVIFVWGAFSCVFVLLFFFLALEINERFSLQKIPNSSSIGNHYKITTNKFERHAISTKKASRVTVMLRTGTGHTSNN